MEPEGSWRLQVWGCVSDSIEIPQPQPSSYRGGHLAGRSGAASDSIIYLDLAVDTITQDTDSAFVCSPRLSSKHVDPSGNKSSLCFNKKRFRGVSSDSTPFPLSLPSLNLSSLKYRILLGYQNCIHRNRNNYANIYEHMLSTLLASFTHRRS